MRAALPSWYDMATILIVEDNETNMKLSSFLLESADYRAQGDQREIAVAIARERHRDLILMDIQRRGAHPCCGLRGYIAKPRDYKAFLGEVKSRLAARPVSTAVPSSTAVSK